jgi:regulator of protease activity HflC (stomatin/prohibitin superfamily)
MAEIMGKGRLAASALLRQRIQEASDSMKLGAQIISVGLQDLHPPVKVAPDYQKVVSAHHTRAAKVLAAKAEAIRTNELAAAQSATLVNRAEAERWARQVDAMSRASLFTNQIPAFNLARSVYAQRAYLDVLVRSTDAARKYVILTTNTQDVLTFDLQDKIREDLLNLTVSPK